MNADKNGSEQGPYGFAQEVFRARRAGQAHLPDLETLGLAQFLYDERPFPRRLPLNSEQLEVRKAGLPPLLVGLTHFLCKDETV